MIESQIPTRSVIGMGALDIFYQEFNDIAFYVEDADQENLYHAILVKYFPDIKIERIFPLGGKGNVLGHARSSCANKDVCKKVYILDKDFDDILSKKDNIKNIFYLDRFCIENYLIDPDAIVELVVESKPKIKRAEVYSRLNLMNFGSELNSQLMPLFKLFFCVQLFELGIKNCRAKPEEFCKNKQSWVIDGEKMSEYLQQIVYAAEEKNICPPLHDPLGDCRVNVIDACVPENVISGKFILAMIFHYVKSNYSLGSITFDSFVYRVAKNSALVSLESLMSQIRKHVYEEVEGLA